MMSNTNQNVSVADALSIAISHFQAGRAAESEEVCRRILSVEPKNADTLHLLGVLCTQTGREREAVTLLTRAIKIRKDVPFYYCNLGIAYYNQGKFFEAVRQYEHALALKPDLAEAHMNIGNVLLKQGKPDEAVARYKKALGGADNALAHYNLGRAFQMLDKTKEAVEQYEKAIVLNPFFAEACTNLGVVYKEMGRHTGAIALHERALEINPKFVEAYNNLGGVLTDLGRLEEAAEQFRKALALDSGNAEAHANLGLTFKEQGLVDDAADRYKQAIALAPQNAEAHFNLGMAYKAQTKLKEALEELERAVRLAPDSPNMLSQYVHQLQHACAWDKIAGRDKKVMEMLHAGESGISPFIVLCLDSTPADQLAAARIYSKKLEAPQENMFRHAHGGRTREKIRLGYLSADYHQHPTAYLMAELFERHDRSRFELAAYSYGPDDGGEMRKRLVRAFDRFVDVRPLSHAAAARKIHDDGIDILIDLKGYTGDTRLQIPAYRPAPVQVSYLGYPGTTGMDAMDYIIADSFILPEDQQPFYSEKIVRLPHSYQPNDTQRKIADATPARAACGLPEQGFVFCSFNSTYKITPAVFDIWMRLLKAVPGSVLWLLESNALVKANLLREAAARGVEGGRLVFAPPLPLAEHLARQRVADLFLDTLPVNAHTTASDALWAGLPVVTCAGGAFIGRVAGSLLSACGLSELITHSLADYEALALRLAKNPEQLQAHRRHLEQARMQSPLFDIGRLTRNLESAYLTMWNHWQSGGAPQAFSIPKE